MILYYACLLIMTMMGAIASMFLKRASGASSLRKLLTNGNLYIGGFLYVLSAVINIWLLRFLDYSVVLPLTSFTYVWTMVLSKVYMNETITTRKTVGVLLIVMGAAMVSLN